MVLDSGRLVEDKGILMENPFRLQRSGLPIEDIVQLVPVLLQQRGGPFLVKADALPGGGKEGAILEIVHSTVMFVIGKQDLQKQKNLWRSNILFILGFQNYILVTNL